MDLFCDCLDAKFRVVFLVFVVLGALGDVKTPSTWRFPPPWKHLILSYISVETLADVCVFYRAFQQSYQTHRIFAYTPVN